MPETILIEIRGDSASAQGAIAGTTGELERMGAAAKGASAQTAAATASMSQKMRSAGAGLTTFGRSWTKYVSLPIAGLGAVATKMSLDFSKSMLLIQTHTDTSRQMVERYRKAVLAMSASGQYTQGPKELSDALYHIASDGYKGTKALDALRQSAHLATLGQSDMATTTYALVSALKTGIRGTENMHAAIGTLNGIVGAGDMKMQDLVGAMSTGVLPAAKSVGLSLSDVGAALDVMTQRGVPAQQAAYRLAMSFSMMNPYTKKAKDEFAALGLGQYDLVKAIKGPTGLLGALQVLQSHLQGLNKYQQTTALQEIFGGGRTSRGMLTLMQNLDGLKKSYQSINHLQGETNKNLKTAMASPANMWAKEWAKLQTTLVQLGDHLVPVLIPALKDLAGAVGSIAHTFDALPKGTQEWILKLGLVAVALGPIVRGLGGILTLTGKVTEGLAGVGAAEGIAGGVGGGAAAGSLLSESSQAARGIGLAGPAGSFVGAGGTTLGSAAVTAAGPLAIAGVGAYVLAQRKSLLDTSAETGQMLASGLAQHFDEALAPALDKATAQKNLPKLTALRDHLKTQIGLALSGGASAADMKPLYQRLRGVQKQVDSILKPRQDFTTGFGKLESGAVTRLIDIKKLFAQNAADIGAAWAQGGQGWRDATVKNMRGVVDAIKAGERAGVITGAAGQKEIAAMMRSIHLVSGDDPFKIAKGFADSWKQAGQVNNHQIRAVLADLAQMPPAARSTAQDTMLSMAQAMQNKGELVKGSVSKLRSALITEFGQTKTEVLASWISLVKGVATGSISLDQAVSIGINAIGRNVNSALKGFGVSKKFSFDLVSVGKLAGEVGMAALGKARGGSIATVAGQGLQDTVPITRDAVQAMVAPGEDLVVLNRHQRPMVDAALAHSYGVNGLSGFFNRFDKPHYLAGGGHLT
ncbi:MAG TPA: phage tail tape measure protein, partial [Gemmatimonadales bacterium]|nr:phage tail tape measure protein [Gemmatimonadales bacterium]